MSAVMNVLQKDMKARPSNIPMPVMAVNPERIIELVESLSLENVRTRVQKEGMVPGNQIDLAISEYRKFLVLIGLGYNNLAMCSAEVDEIWHTHILFTREYMESCNRIFGRYLHHKPNLKSDPIAPGGDVRFFDAYTEVFGDMNPIWNFENEAGCITKPPMCRACQACGHCGDNPDPPDDD